MKLGKKSYGVLWLFGWGIVRIKYISRYLPPTKTIGRWAYTISSLYRIFASKQKKKKKKRETGIYMHFYYLKSDCLSLFLSGGERQTNERIWRSKIVAYFLTVFELCSVSCCSTIHYRVLDRRSLFDTNNINDRANVLMLMMMVMMMMMSPSIQADCRNRNIVACRWSLGT